MRKEDKKFILFLLIVLAFVLIEFFFWVERDKKLDEASELVESLVYVHSEEPTETIEPIELPITETPPITTEEEITQEQTPPDLDIPLDDEYKIFAYQQCNYDDDKYCFIMSVMKCESDFDLYAVSKDGHDFGPMQLREFYHDEWELEFGVQDAKEPHDNITIGIGLLTKYLEKYEYKNLALMCYNNGLPSAKEKWRNGIYSTEYTVKVLNTYKEYLKELQINEGE